jgi:hypothetical protein
MDLFSRTNLLVIILAAVSFFLLLSGVRALRLGSRTIYFRHRRQRVLAGWWMTGAGLMLAVVALLIFRVRELPLAAATPTLPPQLETATAEPSRTSTSTPRPGRTLTATASPTATPHLPLSLEIMVVSSVTPQASAVISDIRFSEALDDNYPIGNRFEFTNPIARMYVSFAYSHMTYGAQFTALWFRNGELVFFESGPWQAGGRGGASLKWEPAPHEWHQGEYEVQFFVGTEWKATGRFTLVGPPPAPTFTPTSTLTPTPSPTWTSSPLPSETPTATSTE